MGHPFKAFNHQHYFLPWHLVGRKCASLLKAFSFGCIGAFFSDSSFPLIISPTTTAMQITHNKPCSSRIILSSSRPPLLSYKSYPFRLVFLCSTNYSSDRYISMPFVLFICPLSIGRSHNHSPVVFCPI